MTHKEVIQRNIGLTFDFVSYLHDNPSELEKCPDNFILEFEEKDFPVKGPKGRLPLPIQKVERKCARVRNAFALL